MPDHYEESKADPTRISTQRSIVLATTLFTGAAGLIYEVTWQRYLANFLGSEAKATAIILAVFLGGLCGGYALFGRVSQHSNPKRLLLLCGWVEVAIGLWGFIFPVLYALIWNGIGLRSPLGVLALPGDIGISILLIGAPTIGMGATLPLLTQALATRISESSALHARIYALNTIGAFAGCLLAGFYLLPAFGLPVTLMMTACINVIAGCALVLCAKQSTDAHPRQEITPREPGSISPQRAMFVAGIAGFYSLALQTVLIRLIGLSMGSSEYAFSMTVSVFILLLAIGAWNISSEHRGNVRVRPLWMNQLAVLFGLALVYATVPMWSYCTHLVRIQFTDLPSAFYLYHVALFALLTAILLVPLGAMGKTLPLLFRDVQTDSEQLGSYVGKLYSINTVGCAAGAIVGGYLLLYVVNLEMVFILCLLLAAGTIVLALPEPSPDPDLTASRKNAITTVSVAAGFAAILCLCTQWGEGHFALGTFRVAHAVDYSFAGPREFFAKFRGERTVIAYKDDPNTTVAVSEEPAGPSLNAGPQPAIRSIWVNGKSDGSTAGGDLRTTRLLAHLPSLLQTSTSESAAVIGFGTGITIGSLSRYDELKHIDVIEISPFVRHFAELFDSYNQRAATDPKVSWVLHDAYRALATSKSTYAVIVSEPSNPWVTGVERLFAKEFYELVAGRLADGGVYAQWFHLYSMSDETLALVLNTFGSVFPEVRMFQTHDDLILLGSKRPFTGSAIQILQDRLGRPAISSDLESIRIPSAARLLQLEQWVPVQAFADAGLQTLDYPQLAFRAGKDFFAQSFVDVHTASIRRNLAWGALAGSKALLRMLLRGTPVTAEMLREAKGTICSTSFQENGRLEENSNRTCASVATGLAVLTGESMPEPLTDEDRTILRNLFDGDQSHLPDNAEQAARAAILFKDFNSFLFPLDADALATTRRICQSKRTADASRCLVEMVSAFGFHGYLRQAEDSLNALREYGPSPFLEDGEAIFRELQQFNQAVAPGTETAAHR